jgi:hypothetical protein
VIDADAALDARKDPERDRTIPPGCNTEDKTILLLTAEGQLHRFDPLTLRTSLIGTMNCDTRINSMTVSRTGALYIGGTTGKLMTADAQTLRCVPTPYDGSQLGFNNYGMGFTADDTPGGESLFIAPEFNNRVDRLMRLDLEQFVAHDVGVFSPSLPPSEVKGTGDGRLFIVHVADNSLSARLIVVDRKTAALGDYVDLPMPANFSGFDFVFWGGDFYVFVAADNDTTSKVIRFSPADQSVRELGRVPPIVVGAGTSTCAPL